MSKETFYFPHDYEPTSDPKIQALLGEFGGLGYGVYWRVVEMLHSDESHKLQLKEYVFLALAKQMLANAEQIMAIISFAINQCELFISDGESLWSRRVNENFERRKEISEKRAISGRLGAQAKHGLANAKQNLAKPGKEKKRKEKEILSYTDTFLSFWSAYPRKESKQTAFEAWKKMNGTCPDIAIILKKIESMKKTDDWTRENGRFIPHPATWINQRRWEDEGVVLEKKSSW